MKGRTRGRRTNDARSDVIVWARRLGVSSTEDVVAELRRVMGKIEGAVDILNAAYDDLAGPSDLPGGEEVLIQLIRGWEQTCLASDALDDIAREIERR